MASYQADEQHPVDAIKPLHGFAIEVRHEVYVAWIKLRRHETAVDPLLHRQDSLDRLDENRPLLIDGRARARCWKGINQRVLDLLGGCAMPSGRKSVVSRSERDGHGHRSDHSA